MNITINSTQCVFVLENAFYSKENSLLINSRIIFQKLFHSYAIQIIIQGWNQRKNISRKHDKEFTKKMRVKILKFPSRAVSLPPQGPYFSTPDRPRKILLGGMRKTCPWDLGPFLRERTTCKALHIIFGIYFAVPLSTGWFIAGLLMGVFVGYKKSKRKTSDDEEIKKSTVSFLKMFRFQKDI